MDIFNFPVESGGAQPTALPSPEKQILALRMIVGAMAAGVLLFAGIVIFVLGPAEGDKGPLTTIGLALGLAGLIAQGLVASWIAGSAREGLPEEERPARAQLMRKRSTSSVVGCAILEAAAFFNLIVYAFLDGQTLSLAMAALLWVAMLMHFPLRGLLEQWMDRELRVAKEERELEASS